MLAFRRVAARRLPNLSGVRYNSSSSLLGKYNDKLQQKIKEEGAVDITDLKAKLQAAGKAHEEPRRPIPLLNKAKGDSSNPKPSGPLQQPEASKYESPVKPLSSFLNVSAILKAPHTAEQISALWTVYHASRSNNTGRGYLSAAIPVDIYEAMLERARKWPVFVLPVPHPDEQPQAPLDGGSQVPVEFHFLQWSFYPAPPVPVSTSGAPQSPSAPNPAVSTAIFTPLVQYKLHQSYAPPYFIMTHYTDFARSHGIVLLRGEITPSSNVTVNPDTQNTSAGDGRYMLSQRDAHLLALGVQQFYLPANSQDEKLVQKAKEAEDLLIKFHEKPSEFEWEKLLKFTDAGLVA